MLPEIAEHFTGAKSDGACTQNWAQLKNNYGAVWEGSTPAAPPLDMQIISNGQTLILRYVQQHVSARYHWVYLLNS